MNDKIQCEICNKVIGTGNNLVTHIKYFHHMNSLQYKQWCYENKGIIDAPIRSIHWKKAQQETHIDPSQEVRNNISVGTTKGLNKYYENPDSIEKNRNGQKYKRDKEEQKRTYDKMIASNKKTLGVSYPMQNKEILDKTVEKRRKEGTFKTFQENGTKQASEYWNEFKREHPNEYFAIKAKGGKESLKKTSKFPNDAETYVGGLCLQHNISCQPTGGGTYFLGTLCPDFTGIERQNILEILGEYYHGYKKTGRTKEEEEKRISDNHLKYGGYTTYFLWYTKEILPYMKGEKDEQELIDILKNVFGTLK